jgi:hypothetical protein
MRPVDAYRRLVVSVTCLMVASGAALVFGDASASASLSYGNRTGVFGESGTGEGQLLLHLGTGAPGAGVAVDNITHDIYVTDTENNRVEKFSAEGAFISAWGWGVSDGEAKFEICASSCLPGIRGSENGQFDTPVSVAVDNTNGPSSGDVYVAERDESEPGAGPGADVRVQKFSPSGNYITQFGNSGEQGSGGSKLGDVRGGNAIFVSPISGNVWVADAGAIRAVEYSPSGGYLAQITETLENAFGVTLDSSGDVYVVNGVSGVHEFGPAAPFAFIRAVDSKGEVDPRAVVTNSSNEVLVGDGEPPGGSIPYRIFQFASSGAEPSPVDTFGLGSIGGSSGIAIDAESGKIYVADGPDSDVDIFALVKLANVSTGGFSDVKGTSATVTGTVDPEGITTHYYIEYGPGLRSAEETSSATSDQPVTVSLVGLEPDTAYDYRLVAVNENGTSLGQDQEFETGPAVAAVRTTCGRRADHGDTRRPTEPGRDGNALSLPVWDDDGICWTGN